MAKVKFDTITIVASERDKEDSRLFVLNRSNPAGNINFNVTDGNGGRIVITIPLTACPIDLSNYSEKESILKNPDFRRLVARGFVVLVNNEQAHKFVTEDPRGIKETRRIYGVIEEGIDSEIELGTIQDDVTVESEAERLGLEASNPFIQNIILRSVEEDSDDLISEIESKLHTLSRSDIMYIAQHANNSDLKAWASAQVEDMDAE